MWAVLWQYDDKSAFGVWCVCETETEAQVIAQLLDMDVTDKKFYAKAVISVSVRRASADAAQFKVDKTFRLGGDNVS